MARDLDDPRPAAAMEATGAKLVRGAGKLVDLRTVEVGGEQLVARKAVVIANGGTAVIPPIPGLDKVEFWTNRQATLPRELPGSLAMLGGGDVGVEQPLAPTTPRSRGSRSPTRRSRRSDSPRRPPGSAD